MNKVDEILAADDDGPDDDLELVSDLSRKDLSSFKRAADKNNALLLDLSDDVFSKFLQLFNETIEAAETFEQIKVVRTKSKKQAHAKFAGSLLRLRQFTIDHCPDRSDLADFQTALYQCAGGHKVFQDLLRCVRMFDAFNAAADYLYNIRFTNKSAIHNTSLESASSDNTELCFSEYKNTWVGNEAFIFRPTSEEISSPYSLSDYQEPITAKMVLPDIITEQEVLESARAFLDDPANKGLRPSGLEGLIKHGPLAGKATWGQINKAMMFGHNGLVYNNYNCLRTFFDFHELWDVIYKPKSNYTDFVEDFDLD